VPRRNLIPLALLAVLALGTLAFAVLGASSAPSGATLAVQNGSTRTFGSPTGATSFTMDLVTTIPAGGSSGAATQVRGVAYVPPSHMTVSQVSGSTSKVIAVLDPAATACSLSTYTAVVGGSTPWTASGMAYVRTETLAAYDARVPHATATSCVPRATAVRGQVRERATLRAGYLVGVRLTLVVPPQTLPNGLRATSGVENQALVVLEIDGTPARALGS
jgi:hypothetical protein